MADNAFIQKKKKKKDGLFFSFLITWHFRLEVEDIVPAFTETKRTVSDKEDESCPHKNVHRNSWTAFGFQRMLTTLSISTHKPQRI